MAEVNYRVDYGAVSHILNTLYVASAMALNGYVHYRIRSNKAIGARWLLLLSFADVVYVSFSTSLSGGLGSRYFVLYYFVVTSFATTFTSLRLNVLWVTVVALIYAALCTLVAPGISLAEDQDKVLLYRVGGLYAVMGLVNLIMRVERKRRRDAVEREGELHRQRIEISQTIHDTTAQWAYLIGLGIEAAEKLGDRSNREQIEKARCDGEAIEICNVGIEASDRRGTDISGQEPKRRAAGACFNFHHHHVRSGKAYADWRRAATIHGRTKFALLDRAQRADERISACSRGECYIEPRI